LSATFFVQPAAEPTDALFGTADMAVTKLQLLAKWGLELGIQPAGQRRLGAMTDEEVQVMLGSAQARIEEWVPGAKVSAVALTDNDLPKNPQLLEAGEAAGEPYRFDAVMLSGGGLAASPQTPDFAAYRIPRVIATVGQLDSWLARIEKGNNYYVSPGE
jgi:hypothetical protein